MARFLGMLTTRAFVSASGAVAAAALGDWLCGGEVKALASARGNQETEWAYPHPYGDDKEQDKHAKTGVAGVYGKEKRQSSLRLPLSAWAYHKSSISQMKFMMPVS